MPPGRLRERPPKRGGVYGSAPALDLTTSLGVDLSTKREFTHCARTASGAVHTCSSKWSALEALVITVPGGSLLGGRLVAACEGPPAAPHILRQPDPHTVNGGRHHAWELAVAPRRDAAGQKRACTHRTRIVSGTRGYSVRWKI